MHILGIETSCDETAAAVVSDGRRVRSSVVASSLKEHQKYGGVIPEIASRRQLELIHAVVNTALTKAGLSLRGLHAIAVTREPGLIGSLLVGLSYARALSFAAGKPLIEVDHIEAHIYANFLRSGGEGRVPAPALPAIGLVVSGGHSSLFLMKPPATFRLLGRTRDDAAGEAFDKVARLLDLGYPGGPVIDRLSRSAAAQPGLRFAPAQLPGTLDFSFSGVKTAVLYHTQRHPVDSQEDKAAVVRAFQESVVDILVRKSLLACRQHNCRTLLVGGGVAANSRLRERLQEAAEPEGVTVHIPPMPFCLDNAAMIAGLGYHRQKTTAPRRRTAGRMSIQA